MSITTHKFFQGWEYSSMVDYLVCVRPMPNVLVRGRFNWLWTTGIERLFFILQLTGHTPSLREARTGNQTGQGLASYSGHRWCCLLACFVRELRTTGWEVALPTVSCSLPHQSQESTWQAYPQANNGNIFSTEVPSSKMILGHLAWYQGAIKLTSTLDL